MASPRLPFDVELAWGTAPAAPVAPPPAAGFVRVFLALLADAGFAALVFFSVVLGAGWGFELSLSALQVAACAAAGGLAAAWVGVCSLWFFHKTVGMHLLRLRLESPVTPWRAVVVWLAIVLFAPLLGLPLSLGRPGARWLERLAGSRLKLEKPGAGA